MSWLGAVYLKECIKQIGEPVVTQANLTWSCSEVEVTLTPPSLKLLYFQHTPLQFEHNIQFQGVITEQHRPVNTL